MNFLTIPPLSYSFWLLLAAFGKLRHISPEGDTENLFTLFQRILLKLRALQGCLVAQLMGLL